MIATRSSIIALGLLAAAVSGTAALAQQVLVCQTLHNDLANFDRRAASVDHAAQAIAATRAANEGSDRLAEVNCIAGNVFATNCEGRLAIAEANRYQVEDMATDHLHSRIGGSDPVRLRIIALMRRNGCFPLEVYATDYLYDEVPGPAKKRLPPVSQIVRAKD
jgi:hypothetical protein